MSDKLSHVVRFGLIKVQIYEKKTPAGLRHNVSLCRLYRNGDQWVESKVFGRDDLPLVAKAVDQAHTWIFAQSQGNPSPAPEESDK